MNSRDNALGWPAWAWRGMILIVVIFAAYGTIGALSNLARAAGLLHDYTPIGMTLERPAGTPSGWSVVTDVAAAGPAADAGLATGDLVRFEQSGGWAVRARAAWPNPIVVERDGERFRTALVARGREDSAAVKGLLALLGIQKLVAIAFGAVLLVRGRGNRAAAQLGIVLVAIGAIPPPVAPWTPLAALAPSFLLVSLLGGTIGCFWLLFSLEISGGAGTPRQALAVRMLAIVTLAVHFVVERAGALPANLPLAVSPAQLGTVLVAANQLFGYSIIALNYRGNDAAARNRIKIVLIAFICFLAGTMTGRILEANIEQARLAAPLFWQLIGVASLNIAGLALLVYAVLRQRLFDLNFALNRTLVYGSVSFVLLAAFGLAKWVIEHLIPESWHAGSEYYSVGIALGLFLVLHRVHDWVERNVERFVFSPWHRNEEALRRFVGAAGHFDQTPVLCQAFADELERFSGGAGTAVYMRERSGSYGLRCGTRDAAPPQLDGDDVALALMRAERGPVRLADTRSALPGVLALPMLDHGKLAGLVLLGRKPAGTDYRPDELELLGWAAHQVGLDLQAMHAGELEAEVAGLSAQVAALSAQLAAARTPRKRPSAA